MGAQGGWTPPRGGYFYIFSPQPSYEATPDREGIARSTATNHALAFTSIIKNNSDADRFLAISPPGTANVYKSAAVEVAWFLVPQPGEFSSGGPGKLQLYKLVRRARLVALDADSRGMLLPAVAADPTHPEVISVPNPNPTGTVNTLADLITPANRMFPGGLTAGGAVLGANRLGEDTVLTNVLSFEVYVVGRPPTTARHPEPATIPGCDRSNAQQRGTLRLPVHARQRVRLFRDGPFRRALTDARTRPPDHDPGRRPAHRECPAEHDTSRDVTAAPTALTPHPPAHARERRPTMVRQHLTHATRLDRRGNTLIVVLSLLSLFAVIGITFVYFTSDQKNRYGNQSQSRGLDTTYGDSGMGAFNAYLATFLYDDFDSGQGMMNALRGHSLMATMYSRMTGATTAFDGVGAFGATIESVTVNGELPFPRIFLTNHRVFPAPPGPLPNWFDPEWSNPRPGGTAVGSGPGQTFIPKNAPYTYPDLNNFFLASIDPRTGEILVPSYVRPNTPGSFGSLAPANPRWRDGTGTVQTVRPTQFIHPNFPLVPQNADNTWTGDVRNRPGGYFYDQANNRYYARNDSIWVDIGLPPMTINGRRVKALVAPLVIDLDAYLNLNVHGNLLGAGGIHASGQGWGKWEVSLERLLSSITRGTIVANRGRTRRGGVGSRAPAYGPLPSYAPVAWIGGGGAANGSLNLPGTGGPLFANDPAYLPPPAFDSANTPVAGHPSLRNPNEWGAPAAGLPRTFSLTDALLFHSRHAGPPGFYALMDVGAAAPTTLRGTLPGPTPNPPGQTTFNPNRTDLAHMNRAAASRPIAPTGPHRDDAGQRAIRAATRPSAASI